MRRVTGKLPPEPLLEILERLDSSKLTEAQLAYVYQQRSRAQGPEGYASVFGVDRICIEFLGIHPCTVYGWDFFEPEIAWAAYEDSRRKKQAEDDEEGDRELPACA